MTSVMDPGCCLKRLVTILRLFWSFSLGALCWKFEISFFTRLLFKGKGKVTLFNVGSSFSYEIGINVLFYFKVWLSRSWLPELDHWMTMTGILQRGSLEESSLFFLCALLRHLVALQTCSIPYLPVYKSTFYDQKISPKNRPRLIHESYTKTWPSSPRN